MTYRRGTKAILLQNLYGKSLVQLRSSTRRASFSNSKRLEPEFDARKGRCEGRKPFGQGEGETATLDLIRSLRRKPKGGKRLSFAAVAAKLNEDSIPSRTGKPWHPEVVRRLLGGSR